MKRILPPYNPKLKDRAKELRKAGVNNTPPSAQQSTPLKRRIF